jgi:hypothetical protein
MEIVGVQMHQRDVMLRVPEQVLPSYVLKDGGLQAPIILHAVNVQQDSTQQAMEIVNVQLHQRDIMLRMQAQVLPSHVLKDGIFQALVILDARHVQEEDTRIKKAAVNVLDFAGQADFLLKLDADQMQNVLDVAQKANFLLKLDAHLM